MILHAIADRILDDTITTTDISDRVHFQRRPMGSNGSCVVIDQRSGGPRDVLDGLPDDDETRVEFSVWAAGDSAYAVVRRVGDRLRTLFEGYRGALGDHFVHGCSLVTDIPTPVSPRDASDRWRHRRTLTMRFTATNNVARV